MIQCIKKTPFPSPNALGIGAASFASGDVAGCEQRYSGKPDGGAVSGAGTPRIKLKFKIES